jgi:glutamate carboxypeptidase
MDYSPMDPTLAHIRNNQHDLVGLIRRLVECESPSDNPAAVNRFVDLVAAEVSPFAEVRPVDGGGRYGRHLLIEFQLPGRKKQGQILALGHSDTVWPLGAIKQMPFKQQDGRLWGPGVLDMKAGIAFFLHAMRTVRELDQTVGRHVVLQLNSDEEIGSPSSRGLTERMAKQSLAVLVLEPGTGLEGKAKTERKGIGGYTIRIRGRAAHAGVDFAEGANAIVELAHQVQRIAGFTSLEHGVTVNVGTITGGTRTNVVPEFAEAGIDIRVPRQDLFEVLDKRMRSLQPVDSRCSIEVEGGLNRPPMERTGGVRSLFHLARSLAHELDVELEESSTGGGSDGNFTAALGIPTLDGIGAVGEGAHASHESILMDRMADRTALLAKLVCSI